MDIKFNYTEINNLKDTIETLIRNLRSEPYEVAQLGRKFNQQCRFYCADNEGSYVDGLGNGHTGGFYEQTGKLLELIVGNLTKLNQIIETKVSQYSQTDLMAIEEIQEIDSLLDSII